MDVFTKLYADSALWARIENVRSYLFIALKNRSLEYIRKNKKWVSAVDLESELLNLSEMPEAYMKYDQEEQHDLWEKLELLLSKLPRKRREAFKMYYLLDMTYTELSTALGLPKRGINTVKTHLSLARQDLLKWRHLLRFIPLPLMFYLS